MEGSGSGLDASGVITSITDGLTQCKGYFWQIAAVGVTVLVAFILWKVLKKAMNKAT